VYPYLAPEDFPVLIRSRSARLAALALAAATPVVASYAAPAFADGNDADVTADVSATNVHVTSSKGLSRVTIVFCGGGTQVADKWGPQQKIGDIVVDGVVQAVFIHSGNNTTPQAQDLLTDLAGADEVNGESTGEIAFHEESVCDETTVIDTTTTTTTTRTTGDRDENGDGEKSDPVISIATDPAPGTNVLGVTIERPAPAVAVSGDTLAAPGGELPRTGAGNMPLEAALAMFLIAAGVSMQAFGRRNRSASFPG
jgi:hypothetical protein